MLVWIILGGMYAFLFYFIVWSIRDVGERRAESLARPRFCPNCGAAAGSNRRCARCTPASSAEMVPYDSAVVTTVDGALVPAADPRRNDEAWSARWKLSTIKTTQLTSGHYSHRFEYLPRGE